MGTLRWPLAWALLAVLGAAAAASPLKDLDGRARSLEEFTGQGGWLVVMIWASDCHVCNAEAHQYVDFHDMHAGRDAAVLGISIDGPDLAAAKAFVQRHSVSFPNLIGEPADVARLYARLGGGRFVGTPSFLIFDPAGELRARQAGAVPGSVIEEFIDSAGRTQAEGRP